MASVELDTGGVGLPGNVQWSGKVLLLAPRFLLSVILGTRWKAKILSREHVRRFSTMQLATYRIDITDDPRSTHVTDGLRITLPKIRANAGQGATSLPLFLPRVASAVDEFRGRMTRSRISANIHIHYQEFVFLPRTPRNPARRVSRVHQDVVP